MEARMSNPVYMVYVCHSVSDRAQLEKYWASIGPTLEGQPIKVLAGYTPYEVLEGENVWGCSCASGRPWRRRRRGTTALATRRSVTFVWTTPVHGRAC